MFVPLPLLILAGFVFAILLVLALRPRGRSDDLLAAPRMILSASPLPGLTAEMRAEVERMVRVGQVIPAIKLVREATGLGLKEAKEIVDRMRQTGVTTRRRG